MAHNLAHQSTLKQYFTDAPEVSTAMAALLGDVEGKSLLEPSVGSGSLLSVLKGRAAHIDAIDIDPAVLALARQRLPLLSINTHCADFIDMYAGGLLSTRKAELRRQYDAVISNPPFGLFFSKDYRKMLKQSFPDLYVRESYGLFFVFSIMMLRSEGRYVFLLPDTFLTSKNHAPLRRFIIENARPSHIIRFPSKRFETVNFGYGNLCIIAGNHARVKNDSSLEWIEAFDESLALLDPCPKATTNFSGRNLREHMLTGWRSSMCEEQPELGDWTTLGDVAECKTGIYTGDNGQFIGYDPARVIKRLNGHSISWQRQVCPRILDPHEMREGLSGQATYVPFIRGGHRGFMDQTAWALQWSADAIRFYKTNKKARLQNSDFYFRPGIAVPMVTARRLSASLIDNAVFDQGVVGVFPKCADAREAILIYLNSSIATKLRNDIVNGSANNSANYLKRLPIPNFQIEDMKYAKELIGEAKSRGELSLEKCDAFVAKFVTT